MRAGLRALFVGILIFICKFGAYALTGSTAVFADAMESTINIVSAGMLVFALSIAARPPDSSHPYGHGKVEFVSAGIEGAAIGFAASSFSCRAFANYWKGRNYNDSISALRFWPPRQSPMRDSAFISLESDEGPDPMHSSRMGDMCLRTFGRASASSAD